ncbi:MAG: hypothetical protein A2Z02_06135 [Chloroflexi bacterium RBG_16_48_7]|nr:MAG: hypothetical protein A2Z02_06135 [Chloroflexi bacterium RBG_16_48_7]
MKIGYVLNIALLALLLVGVGAAVSCDTVRGGAEIWLENVSVGSFTQNGKPIQGIPTGNLSAVLKVSTNKVSISTSATGVTTIKLSPSNAVITTGPDGISITGVESDKIELKLQSTTTTK